MGVESILVDVLSRRDRNATGARMSKNANHTDTNAARDGQQRNCERCGRDRPTNTERFTVTLSDYSASTAAHDKVLLCRECWQRQRDELRRSLA